MAEGIRYRGLDGEGLWNDDPEITLLHSRLSVIDIQGGAQPMASACGRYVVVFNGEIYNYRELAEIYKQHGARFRTASDTEVILEGYRLKGPAVCADLNGMFAFAIWSRDSRTLFLARDHLGKKPLAWAHIGNSFAFASTLEALRALPGFDDTISQVALTRYLVLGAFPGTDTIYAGAQALPAASHMTISASTPTVSGPPVTYWRPAYGEKARGAEKVLLEGYEDLLTDAVRLRLRADVPVALTFSGGVDSGSVAAVARHRLDCRLACYTVDYHTADDPSEESLIAEACAAKLDLPWQHIQYDYHNDLLADLPDAYRVYDQPCQQLALVYSHRLYTTIRPYATVVLSGNGADELFTGYVGDELNRIKDLAIGGTRWLRPLLRHIERLPLHFRTRVPEAFGAGLRQRLLAAAPDAATGEAAATVVPEIVAEAEACGIDSVMDMAMHVSLTMGAGDANFRVPDITGLDAQVEVRSPFLDHRMVAFAASLPHRLKVGRLRGGHNKALLKASYERMVGPEIAHAAKKGMGWNLRWHHSIAYDPAYRAAFAAAYDALDAAGIQSHLFRKAWGMYCDALREGHKVPPTAGTMMSGFMLGMWLQRVQKV